LHRCVLLAVHVPSFFRAIFTITRHLLSPLFHVRTQKVVFTPHSFSHETHPRHTENADGSRLTEQLMINQPSAMVPHTVVISKQLLTG
jgi:hypothetical protein